ncbi:MAG: hypothetical protein WBZ36_28990 [Candidatus Nitrosopolaris sp.]
MDLPLIRLIQTSFWYRHLNQPGRYITSSERTHKYIDLRKNDGGEWKAISNGLPEFGGTIIAILVTNPNREFYAISNRGLFCYNYTI